MLLLSLLLLSSSSSRTEIGGEDDGLASIDGVPLSSDLLDLVVRFLLIIDLEFVCIEQDGKLHIQGCSALEQSGLSLCPSWSRLDRVGRERKQSEINL